MRGTRREVACTEAAVPEPEREMVPWPGRSWVAMVEMEGAVENGR
jgi:hypothetical protein